MFNEFMKEGLHLWAIQFNSKRTTNSYIDQHSVNVSAETIEAALEKVREQYPNAKMLSVNHKGLIDL